MLVNPATLIEQVSLFELGSGSAFIENPDCQVVELVLDLIRQKRQTGEVVVLTQRYENRFVELVYPLRDVDVAENHDPDMINRLHVREYAFPHDVCKSDYFQQ